jgi:hypothetical protein
MISNLRYLLPAAGRASTKGVGRNLLFELAGQSLPGALASGGLTGLMTGDPMAGLSVGAADLLGSTAIARGLASRRLARGVRGLDPKGGKTAGIARGLGGRWAKTETAPGVMGPSRYITSIPQNIGIMGTTFMTPMMVEPMFQKAPPVGQTVTTTQQLAQRKDLNRSMMTGPLSAGTMFQLAGTPVPSDVRGIY